jgi:quercetin dioxygenase-like cupin family protein
MRITGIGVFMVGVMVVSGSLGLPSNTHAGEEAASAAPAVAELMTREVAGLPAKEVLMLTVTYLPGGASMPHRHDAQVFVYVLEGAMRMQIDGAAPVIVGPGQTFYEGPRDVHRVSANASQTEGAKILVFMIKDKGRRASSTVPPKESP